MRDRILTAAIYGLFALIMLGLFYTQVLRYFHYSRLSKNNVIRIIPIDGPRGVIYDRNGVALVTNRLSFDVAVVCQELRDAKELSELLTRALGVSGQDIARALDRASLRPYAPVTIVEDIDKEKALMLDEASFDVGGLVIETRSRRSYPYGETGSHLFGYLSEVTEQELERLRDYGYRMRDLIGRAGLEKHYNRYLAGVDGGVQIQVDNRGRQAKVLGLKEPENGKDLYLTVDLDLQLACDKILKGRKGAAIVLDPRTGEVLALASRPAFDPNIFVRPGTSGERTRLLRDRRAHPLIDRATSGLYAPGSVFKVVTASAALETRKINAQTTFNCTGSYRLGKARFNCWKESGHGPQDITAGLMNSCNVFFYNAGRLAGVDALEAYAKLFGFGKPTGIDLPDEAAGIVPGRLWKRLRKNEAWYEGETVNYSIGQGYLLVTPL
ncbi:MAG: penicillin-binding protein 2, partial [Candidatus Omnitrophica bacterium]|nr:penicillin-binding protein 2 [Candidatus Omnitrophota bacterium]